MSEGEDSAQQQKLRRILITADAVGGVWQYTVDLVRSLVKDHVAVMVVTMGPAPSSQQLGQMPAGVQVVSREYALEWMEGPWADVDAAGDWLLKLRDEWRPDIVHMNGYVHASLPWRCPVLIVAHSCVGSWWRAVHGVEPGLEWDRYRRRVRGGLLACNRVVAPSAFMAGEIALHYRISSSKVRVISNFSSAPVARRLSKEPFCLAAGRVWDQAKNFALLQQVAGQVPWPICLAGDGSGRDLAPVQMLGSLSHESLQERMDGASVFLHPAVYEPFGLAVLEAARAGCCLLLADTPSARELWGRAAIFLSPQEPSQWVRVLNRLIADPDERACWGKAALSHSQQYTEERFCQSYAEVYSNLLMLDARRKEAAA